MILTLLCLAVTGAVTGAFITGMWWQPRWEEYRRRRDRVRRMTMDWDGWMRREVERRVFMARHPSAGPHEAQVHWIGKEIRKERDESE